MDGIEMSVMLRVTFIPGFVLWTFDYILLDDVRFYSSLYYNSSRSPC